MKYKYTYIFRLSDGRYLHLENTENESVSVENLFKYLPTDKFVYGYLPHTKEMVAVNMNRVIDVRIKIEEIP